MKNRTIIFVAGVVLPLAIISIVLAISSKSCDYEDVMKLNVAHYLLGYGISSIILWVFFVASFFVMTYKNESTNYNYNYIGVIGIRILSVVNALFGLAWFIVGAIILFRSNIDCIRNESAHVVFALVVWILSVIQICMSCVISKLKKNDSS